MATPGLLSHDDPLVAALVANIQRGDLSALQQALTTDPGLASTRIAGSKGGSSTLLHVATDWPGYFPNGPAVVRALLAAGADPNASVDGAWHAETPLHWAASSDDVDVAEALIDGGANIEATGASIAGGTPLDDAVGYGCWRVARLLVARGARVEKLWHAAALGMTARVVQLCSASPAPTSTELNNAFWQACHGGQRRTAEYLLERGADLNWIPAYAKQTPLGVAMSIDTGRENLVGWLKGRDASAGT
ncbi:MAG: ankyrin repeat domain-containing protein [Gemmatimonadaceae bacterium]